MLRKFLLLIGVVTASMAIAGVGTAVADSTIHPDCLASGNQIEVRDFTMDTPFDNNELALGGVEGSGLACGTEITTKAFSCSNQDSLYETAEILLPRGVRVASTDNIESGRYVGTATVDTIQVLPLCSETNHPKVVVAAESPLEARPIGTGECPGNEIACYRGHLETNLGIPYAGNENWIVPDPDRPGRLKMIIGPTSAIGNLVDKIGLVKISMSLCTNFGKKGQQFGNEECGVSTDPIVQRNGYESVDTGCVAGKADFGKYTITATMRNKTKTDPVDSCVTWNPRRRTLSAVQLGG